MDNPSFVFAEKNLQCNKHCVCRQLAGVCQSEQLARFGFFCGQLPGCAALPHSFVHRHGRPSKNGWSGLPRAFQRQKSKKPASLTATRVQVTEQQAGYRPVTKRLPKWHTAEAPVPKRRCLLQRKRVTAQVPWAWPVQRRGSPWLRRPGRGAACLGGVFHCGVWRRVRLWPGCRRALTLRLARPCGPGTCFPACCAFAGQRFFAAAHSGPNKRS